MLRALTVIHRWLGLGLALILGAVAISGGALLFKGSYWRWRLPVLAQPITAAERSAIGSRLEQIAATFGDRGPSLIKVPQPGMNAFQIWLTDESEAFIDPRSGEVLATWTPHSDLAAWLFELHAHLLVEPAGSVVNGTASIAACFLALSGVLMWWPRRRSAFLLRHAWMRSTASASWLRSHAAIGLLTAPAILVFAATGTTLIFNAPTTAFVTRLLDAAAPARPTAVVRPRESGHQPWPAIWSRIEETFPNAQPVYISPGTTGNAAISVRKRQPAEWHPNGRTYILLDPYTATVVQTIDAVAQGPGSRFMNTMYPVHAATIGGIPMTVAALAGALGLAWVSVSGVSSYTVAFVRRRRARRRTITTAS